MKDLIIDLDMKTGENGMNHRKIECHSMIPIYCTIFFSLEEALSWAAENTASNLASELINVSEQTAY
ncbi:hypothetical protein KUTeg_002910 [Tegillarca granosa]|uniref:Uncharacterized protein n=1 Tax=Tegillarca granosa TaxID=220873 RepID=A0ABQ9FQI0_TEGGR|nr:hypothetical protein KUTeg_002910 [Tegillarca granosa]